MSKWIDVCVEMKKWIIVLLMASVLFTACGPTMEKEPSAAVEREDQSMFVIVEDSLNFRIVYHKDTRVMYAISRGGYNCGNFTVLLNPDGTPMTWK